MKLWLIANSYPLLWSFLLLTVAILFFFALRWHADARGARFQPKRRNVVDARTRNLLGPPLMSRRRAPLTTWEAGRRG